MNREGYQQRGLYDPAFEHDACGIGAVVDIKGRQSYETVDSALKIVEKLEHRAGKDAEGKTGDGVGILLQISRCQEQNRDFTLSFHPSAKRKSLSVRQIDIQ